MVYPVDPMEPFQKRGRHFLLNGQEFHIRSGSIHYFRSFPEQWEDLLIKLRDMGCNTVETYCCWNLSEPEEGVYDFTGRLDVSRFLQTAQKVGLYAIVRPGPYICAEWDYGGLPGWLLQDPEVKVRTLDPRYFLKASAYMHKLMEQIVPHLVTRGGNVILMAVENEYGGYGSSRRYMNACAQLLRQCHVDVPLFTSDGTSEFYFRGGSADDAFTALDFGYLNGRTAEQFAELEKAQPDAPLLHVEHWIGRIRHWGDEKEGYPAETAAKEVQEHVDSGYHGNFYMFHGGTNFGFTAGANAEPPEPGSPLKYRYKADITSYDYDAILTEWGEATPKYHAIQQIMEKTLGKKLPAPAPVPTQALGHVDLPEKVSLWDCLDRIGAHHQDVNLYPMEHYGQSFGYILYRHQITTKQRIDRLVAEGVRDRALIFFNGVYRGRIDRNMPDPSLETPGFMDEGGTLDILVENLGRVNFGQVMLQGERKGILDGVSLIQNGASRQLLFDWDVYNLPMDDLEKLSFVPKETPDGSASGRNSQTGGPAFFRGTFRAGEQKDCFIQTGNLNKGFITVNGFNLGRYWKVGPQKALYLPYPLLKEENEIVIFEEDPQGPASVEITAEPGW